MPQTDSFPDLIRRVRSGDAEAAEELWRRFEPILSREIRLRLRDPRLRRLFDENDVCQSVMASFFVRAAAGQFELEGPEHLQHLLLQMGRHKLTSQTRRHQAQRRDCRRVEALAQEQSVVGGGSSPSQSLAWRELLQRFREHLDAEERQLTDLRAQGRSWLEIADLLGGTADGRRIQLNRAVARVSRELGLEGTEDD